MWPWRPPGMFSCRIVDCAMLDRPYAQLMLRAQRRAGWVMLHSGHGCGYTSIAFRLALSRGGCAASIVTPL